MLPVSQEGEGGDLRELREAAVKSYSALCKQASPVKPASAPALPRKPKLTLNILMVSHVQYFDATLNNATLKGLMRFSCPATTSLTATGRYWNRGFKHPWREAGPPNHHDDKVDPDQ